MTEVSLSGADGQGNLPPFNAIAKEMGMSGPALYRYFAGRDELITALIRDAYRSLADTVRAAHEAGTTVVALAAVIREA